MMVNDDNEGSPLKFTVMGEPVSSGPVRGGTLNQGLREVDMSGEGMKRAFNGDHLFDGFGSKVSQPEWLPNTERSWPYGDKGIKQAMAEAVDTFYGAFNAPPNPE